MKISYFWRPLHPTNCSIVLFAFPTRHSPFGDELKKLWKRDLPLGSIHRGSNVYMRPAELLIQGPRSHPEDVVAL